MCEVRIKQRSDRIAIIFEEWWAKEKSVDKKNIFLVTKWIEENPISPSYMNAVRWRGKLSWGLMIIFSNSCWKSWTLHLPGLRGDEPSGLLSVHSLKASICNGMGGAILHTAWAAYMSMRGRVDKEVLSPYLCQMLNWPACCPDTVLTGKKHHNMKKKFTTNVGQIYSFIKQQWKY